MDEIHGWFSGRLPDGWFEGPAELSVDREEIVVVGTLAEVTGDGGSDEAQRAAEAGRIERFREETRRERMRIADDAERRFGRKVAWGAACGETRQVFTNIAAPVMTRLRQPERQVLDTLVDAGVARSRSEALAWCVRLVGQHEDDWLQRLRAALVEVHAARSEGPA
jgi:hypothetical protein